MNITTIITISTVITSLITIMCICITLMISNNKRSPILMMNSCITISISVIVATVTVTRLVERLRLVVFLLQRYGYSN